MPASPEDLFAFLDGLNIRHATITHPPLFTVEDSQALRGKIPGGHTKNLFLKDKADALFLVVAEENAPIELKSIHHRIGGKRVSFGSAELLLQHSWRGSGLGDTVCAHQRHLRGGFRGAGRRHDAPRRAEFSSTGQHMTTSIAARDLVTFIKATGHEPRILQVSGGPESSGRGGFRRIEIPAKTAIYGPSRVWNRTP